MVIKLQAKPRTIEGKKVYQLRNQGIIPAVIFGHGEESQSIELKAAQFEKVFKEAGENTIIDLDVDGKISKILVSDVQYDPVKNTVIHADLHKINMSEKITANVEINFIGESKAVKEDGGSIIHNISEVEIKCLPMDLLHEIEVDVSALETFDDVIKIKDLKIPENVEIEDHEPEDVVASVARIQEEKEEPIVAPTEGEEVAQTEEVSAEGENQNQEEKK